VAAIRAALPRGTPIELWWQDEARVGQKNGITRRWAKRGTRPSAPKDQRTKSAYIFGAICPERGIGAAIISPAANTIAMNHHLAEISTQVTSGAHAVLIVDGAGWHQAGQRLRVPENISLLRLPPYSPELNSMENVWNFLRANKLCNLVWDTYEEIVDDCVTAWNFLINDPNRIRSIGARSWACVSV
jgi:hypothetical protein